MHTTDLTTCDECNAPASMVQREPVEIEPTPDGWARYRLGEVTLALCREHAPDPTLTTS